LVTVHNPMVVMAWILGLNSRETAIFRDNQNG
jgi:hypothetical protein